MNNHPTSISLTTRPGSRRHVPWLNQPGCSGKGEPGRRSACACARARIVTPGAKAPSPRAAVLDASPLLVILHYLLKNNTEFMMCMEQVPTPPGGSRESGDPNRPCPSTRGRWGV